MSPKISRPLSFVFFALVNLGLIWLTLSTTTAAPLWVYLVIMAASVIEDSLIIGWSLWVLPNYGFTEEENLAGVWSIGQVLQLLILTILAGLTSFFMAVIVLALSILWIVLRVPSLNKLMDLRYWF